MQGLQLQIFSPEGLNWTGGHGSYRIEKWVFVGCSRSKDRPEGMLSAKSCSFIYFGPFNVYSHLTGSPSQISLRDN